MRKGNARFGKRDMGYVQTLNSLVLGLFASGEPGFWLDPSDLSTMYQDSSGTTPVTAVEQPVGRINDKSGRGCNYTQSTAGVRPVLSARVNLLTKTEQFDNAAWTKANGGTGTLPVVTANQGVAPDGTTTADRIVFARGAGSTASDYSVVYQTATVASGVSHKGGTYVKSNTGSSQTVMIYLTQTTPVVVTMSVGQSWTLVPGTVTTDSTSCSFAIGTRGGTYGGDASLDLLVWGADLRPSDQATGLIPTYQRVNTSTDYDTAGFPLYLSGNGTQWMQCAAQDYTGVNKMMIVSGLRKLSDATVGMVYELSTSYSENNGTWALYAATSHVLESAVRGTVSLVAVDSNVILPPSTSVTTMLQDMAAPSLIQRNNGAQTGASTSTQGGGNLGNYAAYLFARAGSSLFFTGQIFQIVARGSTVASNAAQISAAESWTDLKTRAY